MTQDAVQTVFDDSGKVQTAAGGGLAVDDIVGEGRNSPVLTGSPVELLPSVSCVTASRIDANVLRRSTAAADSASSSRSCSSKR